MWEAILKCELYIFFLPHIVHLNCFSYTGRSYIFQVELTWRWISYVDVDWLDVSALVWLVVVFSPQLTLQITASWASWWSSTWTPATSGTSTTSNGKTNRLFTARWTTSGRWVLLKTTATSNDSWLFTCKTVWCLYARLFRHVFRLWAPTKVFSIRLRWLHLSPLQGHGPFRRLDVPAENVSLPIWIQNGPCDERRRWKTSPTVLMHSPEHLIPHAFSQKGPYSQSVSPMSIKRILRVFGKR